MPVRQYPKIAPANQKLTAALTNTVSHPRLGPYLKAAGFDRERAIKLYLWNVAVGQSFHFPLQVFEVALRNSVSAVFASQFGKNWWQKTVAEKYLGKRSLEELEKAQKRLVNRGIKPNDNDIIADMSFGFWVSLLASRYNPVIWSKNLGKSFPNMKNKNSQKDVYNYANRVLVLRNRIFHHEPIISRDLSFDYSSILTPLNWICPETAMWTKANSSVPQILRLKP